MNPDADPVAGLRAQAPDELARAGAASLCEHLAAQALVARERHGPLTFASLEAFLADRACLRYPTRLVFEFGEMALHQFAQPDLDPRDPEGKSRVLYLRPSLREQPDLIVIAAAYMVPAINYGEIVTDDHCVEYGAALLGMTPDAFYQAVCALADATACEPRTRFHCP